VLIGKLAGIFCDVEMQGLWIGFDRLEGAMLDFDNFTQRGNLILFGQARLPSESKCTCPTLSSSLLSSSKHFTYQ
jgi:hypothetical protein